MSYKKKLNCAHILPSLEDGTWEAISNPYLSNFFNVLRARLVL